MLRAARGFREGRTRKTQHPESTVNDFTNRKKKIFDEKTIESKAIAQEEAITVVFKRVGDLKI